MFVVIEKDEERLYKEDLAADSDDSDDEEKGQEDDSVRIGLDCWEVSCRIYTIFTG